MKTALAILLFATAACSTLADGPPATMEVRTPAGRRGANDLDAPTGLGGLVVKIEGIVQGQTRIFVADDFKTDIPPFRVPDLGAATVTVTLTQDGDMVAQGVSTWTLEPKAQWRVAIERSHHPSGVALEDEWPEDTAMRCFAFWCHRAWRFGIREDVANQEDESIWVLVWRWHLDECADVCP